MRVANKSTDRNVTVRTISGHNVDIGSSYSSGVAALDPSTNTGRQLAGAQPNTDRRRYLVRGAK